MKNFALAFALTCLLAACSSGSSVSEIPPNDISGRYTGSFESTNELSDGTLTLNIQDAGGTLTGNLIVEFDPDEPSCVVNSAILGDSVRSGFNVTIITTSITFTLTASTDGRTLSGSFVPTSGTTICSNSSGSANITLTR